MLLAEHQVLVGPRKDTTAIERTHTSCRPSTPPGRPRCWSAANGPVIDPAWEGSEVRLEEMVLAYMGQDAAPASPT